MSMLFKVENGFLASFSLVSGDMSSVDTLHEMDQLCNDVNSFIHVLLHTLMYGLVSVDFTFQYYIFSGSVNFF